MENQASWHGNAPSHSELKQALLDLEVFAVNNIATREAYGQVLVELGDLRDDIVVLDADLSKSTKTCEFAKKFPKRFFNMGIAEQNLIGAACGLSTTGKIPFVSTFAVFATGRAFEIKETRFAILI